MLAPLICTHVQAWRYLAKDNPETDVDIGITEKGFSLSAYGIPGRVISTPGHTEGSVSVLLESGEAFVGDLAMNKVPLRFTPGLPIFAEDIHRVKASWKKLMKMGAETIYPGHGKPFTDFKGAISKSKKKVRDYMKNKEKTGIDLLKKITIYTLLMHRQVDADSFFDHLMETYWFRETIDHYFRREYELKYNEIMNDFLRRGIIERRNGSLFTTVKP